MSEEENTESHPQSPFQNGSVPQSSTLGEWRVEPHGVSRSEHLGSLPWGVLYSNPSSTILSSREKTRRILSRKTTMGLTLCSLGLLLLLRNGSLLGRSQKTLDSGS